MFLFNFASKYFPSLDSCIKQLIFHYKSIQKPFYKKVVLCKTVTNLLEFQRNEKTLLVVDDSADEIPDKDSLAVTVADNISQPKLLLFLENNALLVLFLENQSSYYSVGGHVINENG